MSNAARIKDLTYRLRSLPASATILRTELRAQLATLKVNR